MQAKKRYGQHFLEPAWADKVVAAIEPRPDDRFLEIGAGPGALTIRLAPRVHHVTAVELDPRMVAALAPKAPANVDLIQKDFLELDVAPIAAAAPLRVAGNLPYNASSPILFRLIDIYRQSGRLIDATVMLQHEVGERIEAAPGSKDYGVLSILVQLHASVRRLLTLPPGAFRPMPAVRSAVLRLTFRPPAVEIADHLLFERMVRAMFTQRRKTLGNALRVFAANRNQEAAAALETAGIDPRRRPETLTLADLGRLTAALATKGKPML